MNSVNLRLQKVDVAASLLMSLWVLSSLLLVACLAVWWNSFVVEPDAITLQQTEGRGHSATAVVGNFEPPAQEEFNALQDPSLVESLAAVTDAASSVAATDIELSTLESTSIGGSHVHPSGPGTAGDGTDIVSRFERWELKFLAKDLKTYSSQLDFCKIELGCIGKSKLVDYASGFVAPQKRSGKGSDEKRLYFMWRQPGPLLEFDRQLLNQAGVETQGRQMLKFIPKELEESLYETEMKYALSKGHAEEREIAKTVFESRAGSSGFEFVVVSQRYR